MPNFRRFGSAYTANEIVPLKQRDPFQPIRFVLKSGMNHDVFSSNMLMVGVREIRIGVPWAKNPGIVEYTIIVPLQDIADIRDVPPSST